MLHALRYYTFPLLLAVLLHAAAVWALMSGWNPDKEVQNFVKPKTVVANLVVIEPKAKPAPSRPDPAVAQRRAQEQARQREAQRAAQEEARKKAADLEAKRQAEADAKKAEEARKQAEAEQARLDRLARLSALSESSMLEAIENESANLESGTEEALVQSYHAAIYELVRMNWSRPPSARNGMSARLLVELIPTGEVVAVTVVDSSGDAAFDRSAQLAVNRARRFEVPEENRVFERHFRRFYLLFQPEDLLR